MEHVGTFQVDGRLNPVDALSKWLEVAERIRHYLFLMGQPAKALQVWRVAEAASLETYHVPSLSVKRGGGRGGGIPMKRMSEVK